MRIQLIMAFVGTLICSKAFGQEKDTDLLAYINHKEGLVALTDSSISTKSYYGIIEEYMAKNNLKVNDYYVWTSQIRNDNNTLIIPIHHYDGFKLLKELEDQNTAAYKARKEGELFKVIDFNGNASGKDGNLEVDLGTKQISFALWQ